MWMEISNLEKLINFSRKLVYHNFNEENNGLTDQAFLEKVESIKDSEHEEMNHLLPYNESKTIFKPYIKKVISKKSKNISYRLKEDDYDDILNQLNKRMVSNIVKDLVNKGLVESAFDNEKNDFVFWVKEDDKYSEE
tara:strand:- start:702 stop:1112 length:411 start_codon:yes stop_codon:yes gene_type:complete